MDSPEATKSKTLLPVLLVEDSLAEAQLIMEMLGEANGEAVDVVRVQSLAGARERLLAGRVSGVLLDLALPDADGLSALTELRTIAPEVPVVVLTGQDDEELAIDALRAGAQDYLVKGHADGYLIARSLRFAGERRRAELELTRRSLEDPLTELPNRVLFLDRVERALARSERSGSSVAVLFMDLGRFKLINDSLGHDAGDRILVETAERLKRMLRPSDTVGRFGGDEFTILCEEIGPDYDAISIARRVSDALSAPYTVDGQELFVSASIGIALGTGGRTPAQALIRNADVAMYRAKERGGSAYEVFDERMRSRALKRLDVESQLRRAIERGEFRVHYQPLVHFATGRVIGVEALVRWQHPKRGLVTPPEFMPLAEDTGLIVPLGEWVLTEACRQIERWTAENEDARFVTLFVNVSERQLADPDFVANVARTLADTGVDPSQLCLELKEAGAMSDPESTVESLRALRGLGVNLAIDDFGALYSSVSYLNRFPLDLIKIDRSVIHGFQADPRKKRLVGAVIGLAHALELSAVAEGVEERDDLAELRELGCDGAQGFYFANAQEPATIGELLGRKLAIDGLDGSNGFAHANGDEDAR